MCYTLLHKQAFVRCKVLQWGWSRKSKKLYFEDFNEAVAVVERFFDLEYKLFETLTNPTTKDVKSSKELTSILKG